MLSKKLLFSAALINACMILASCGEVAESEPQAEVIVTQAETSEEAAEVTSEAEKKPELEETVAAESGDAYLAINEKQGWIQYWGDDTDENKRMLAYDAGVARITGDGSYTVSVNADTRGFRYETSKNPDDYTCKPYGLMFTAVMVKDGKKLFPNAVITVDAVRVDGKEIELKAKNYTSSDDGVELRTNVYNSWIDVFPGDAASPEGALVVNGMPTEIADGYSPCIVDPNDFGSWTKVEVDFTISGTGL